MAKKTHILDDSIKINFRTATPEEKLQVKEILDAHYFELTSQFVAEADYCTTTSYWAGHTPHGEITSAKRFIEGFGKKKVPKPKAPPVASMMFDPIEMKVWDSRFKTMAAEFGAVKHSLEAKVFIYFGMVFMEFATITFEFNGGMKIGHSGKDYLELENNIVAVLKIYTNQPNKPIKQ